MSRHFARYFALLPAAGVGARMGASHPKQYLDILGRPMIWHAIRAFEEHPGIDRVYVVISPDDGWWAGYDWSGSAKLSVLRRGGATRAETVLNGLAAIAGDVAAEDWVLVHDAARPCLTRNLLDKLMGELGDDPVGGILAAPVADTLKRQGRDGRIAETVPRRVSGARKRPRCFVTACCGKPWRKPGTRSPTRPRPWNCRAIPPGWWKATWAISR